MRKILFVIFICFLCFMMFLIAWRDVPSMEFVKTYLEIQDAYAEYDKTLQTLKQKNDVELPAEKQKLSTEYTDSDTDNVVKLYNDNKKIYEDLVALQKANDTLDSADIYDIDKIWIILGKYSDGLIIDMDVTKAETDLDSEDYIMCDLSFQVTGKYVTIAEFIDNLELDSVLTFKINDFFMEGYNKTSRNQNKDTNMDTNNIPSANSESESGDDEFTGVTYSNNDYSSSTEENDSHALDVVANFKVYNIPLNRKTVTNVKNVDGTSDASTSTDDENLLGEDMTEENTDGEMVDEETMDEETTDEESTDEESTDEETVE